MTERLPRLHPILTVAAVTRSDFEQYAHEQVVLVGHCAMVAQTMSMFGVGAPDVTPARGTG